MNATRRPQVISAVPSTILFTILCLAGAARAQLPPPATPWQFDLTGFLQEATVADAGNALSGGRLMVNGHVVTVPANTIVLLPASALTWQELFAYAPAPWGIPGNPGVTSLLPTTGMAMADCAAVAVVPGVCPAPPLTTHEVHVVGNVEGTEWVAGLVDFSQQSLNQGQGYVTAIAYLTNAATGATETELQVATGNAANPVTRVRINDPVVPDIGSGRYSAGQSPDVRFMVDQDNPTIRSGSGFPMCLPRTDPAIADDPLCPQAQRPIVSPGPPVVYAGSVQMNDPTNPGLIGVPPDPLKQAPFEVGDYVTFSGNLVKESPAGGFALGDGATVGPWPGAAATYLSAHTLVNNVAIYTWPGTNPAYVALDVTLMGTGGVTVVGGTEAANRTRFEGFTTDPSRFIHLYGMDLTSAGAESDRDWGSTGVDPGPPTGAVKGRWRFRPPCKGSISFKDCVGPANGVFLPATREVRAVLQGAWTAGAPVCASGVKPPCNTIAGNGLLTGQYHAPIAEYIFPEQILGAPVPPANFDTIPFLASGGYSSVSGVLAPGPLVPFPSSATGGTCAPPTAVAGGPGSAAAGDLVTLDGRSSIGGPPIAFQWTQAATDPALVTLANADTSVATFTAPGLTAGGTLNFTLTVSACGVASTTSIAVTIASSSIPTVSLTPANPVTVVSGTPASVSATGVDPGGFGVSVAWTQTNAGTPGVPVVVNPNPMVCGPAAGTVTCPLSFTVSLPFDSPSQTINLYAQATNSLGQRSGRALTSVTVKQFPDTVTITSAEYRTLKQRLIVNATTSVVSPNVVLTLEPYVAIDGATWNLCPPGIGCTMTNLGAGNYVFDAVGVIEPATPPAKPLMVQSSLGGLSAPSVLTRIRQ